MVLAPPVAGLFKWAPRVINTNEHAGYPPAIVRKTSIPGDL
jgi:hypothetical protein